MTREQFIEHVKSHQNALRSYLLALCSGNMAEADDIAQEALVKAYLAIDKYVDSGKFRAWLFRIAHNVFLNHVAARKPTVDIEEAKGLLATDSADSGFEHQKLYRALSVLPPKERSAITLYYINGYSVKEIATITETSENSVKKQMSRGREKLKATLEP